MQTRASVIYKVNNKYFNRNDNKRIIEEEKDTPEKREFKKRVKDWGLRHSTLEEVFIRVRNKIFLV